MTSSDRLDSLRGEIQHITLDIIRLTGQRRALAKEVAIEKTQAGIPIRNLEIENHLRDSVERLCKTHGFDVSFGINLLNQLILDSIRLQEKGITSKKAPTVYDVFVKARALEKAGKELLHLEVGEPDFGPPEAVMKAIIDAVELRKSKYIESAGIFPLREKIASIVSHRNEREISPEEVIVTVSGRFALFQSIATHVHPGDEVIIVDPSYPGYSDCVKEVGGKPVHFPTHLNTEWGIDLDLLKEYIIPTTKAIILNSPCNPTGKVLNLSTLKGIADIASANDIQIISDEVYSSFSVIQHASILDLPGGNSVLVDSFSKRYGMTGFRLGYAISDVDTIHRMTQIQNLYVTCGPEFVQYAGISALDCDEDANHYSDTIKKRLETASRQLERLPLSFHTPEGGFYIFPELAEGSIDGQVFADRLLSETGVCVVPGAAFGHQYTNFFRLSVCQPEGKLVEAIERMGAVLE